MSAETKTDPAAMRRVLEELADDDKLINRVVRRLEIESGALGRCYLVGILDAFAKELR